MHSLSTETHRDSDLTGLAWIWEHHQVTPIHDQVEHPCPGPKRQDLLLLDITNTPNDSEMVEAC